MRITAFAALTLSLAVVAPASGQAPQEAGDRGFFLAQVIRAIDEKSSLLIEQGRLEEAIAELEGASALEVPREHPAFDMKVRLVGRLAITLTATGRGKEGIETVTKLLAEAPPGSPAEAAAWLDAGVVYRQAGRPEEALKAFDKAIELAKKLAEGGRLPPRVPPGDRRPRPLPNGGPR